MYVFLIDVGIILAMFIHTFKSSLSQSLAFHANVEMGTRYVIAARLKNEIRLLHSQIHIKDRHRNHKVSSS